MLKSNFCLLYIIHQRDYGGGDYVEILVGPRSVCNGGGETTIVEPLFPVNTLYIINTYTLIFFQKVLLKVNYGFYYINNYHVLMRRRLINE